MLKKIPFDNITRWNSTYYMIKVTLELKEVVLYILNLTINNELKKYTLTNTDWEALQELNNIFTIFASPIIKLQG